MSTGTEVDPADATEDGSAAEASSTAPGRGAVAAWVAYAGVGAFFDGPIGLAAAFVVAFLALARIPRVWIGRIGALALLAVPVSILVIGVPTEAQVSPRFVNRSSWPTHLAFVGLALVAAHVVLELAPALASGTAGRRSRRRDAIDDARTDPAPGLGVPLRWALVGVGAAGLGWACLLVLTT